MSGNVKGTKDGAGPAEEAYMNMQADDMKFLVDCLKNPVGGGNIHIDAKAVAEALGYRNAGSVANRINKLKKRFNLPINATSCGNKKIERSSDAEAMAPITPSKNKVTKTSTPRARTAKTKKKATHSDSEFSGEGAGKSAATKKSVGGNVAKGLINEGTFDSDEGEVSYDNANEGEEEEEEDGYYFLDQSNLYKSPYEI